MFRLLYIILLFICNQQSRLCMKDIWIRCVRAQKNVHEPYVKRIPACIGRDLILSEIAGFIYILYICRCMQQHHQEREYTEKNPGSIVPSLIFRSFKGTVDSKKNEEGQEDGNGWTYSLRLWRSRVVFVLNMSFSCKNLISFSARVPAKLKGDFFDKTKWGIYIPLSYNCANIMVHQIFCMNRWCEANQIKIGKTSFV